MLSNQKLFSVGNFDFRLQHLLVIGVLALSVSISIMIRSTPATYGLDLFEFDPFFNFRATEYLVENGYVSYSNWVDEKSWHPFGRDVSENSQITLHLTTAIFYKLFGFGSSLYHFTIIFPLIVGSITSLIVFAFVRVLGGTTAGLIAALMFSISTPIFTRGLIGWFKSEPLGLLFGFVAMYLFVSGIMNYKGKSSLIKLVLSGLFLSLGFSAWGGILFFIIPILIFYFIIPFMKQENNSIIFAIPIFSISVIAFSLLFERTSQFTTDYVGMLIILSTAYFVICEIIKKFSIDSKRIRNCSVVLISMIVSGVGIISSGIIDLPGFRYLNAVNPFLTTLDPLTDSVSEHATTDLVTSYVFISVFMIFSMIGIWFLFSRKTIDLRTDKRIFALVTSIVAIYLSSSFVRLELYASVGVIILGSIGLAILFKKLFHSNIFPPTKIIFCCVIILLFLIPVTLPENKNWLSWADFSPTIYNGGSFFPITNNDWAHAMTWLKHNTHEDSVIASWWDYGYWITTLSDRTTIIDNATLIDWQIKKMAYSLITTPDNSWHILNSDSSVDVSKYLGDEKIIEFGGIPEDVFMKNFYEHYIPKHFGTEKNYQSKMMFKQSYDELLENQKQDVDNYLIENGKPKCNVVTKSEENLDLGIIEQSCNPVTKGMDADYIVIFVAAERFAIQDSNSFLYLLDGGADESKKTWFMKISNHELSVFLESDHTTPTSYFMENSTLGKLIPFSIFKYVDSVSDTIYDEYQPGFITVYEQDIQYLDPENDPFYLVYASPTFFSEIPGPVTSILIYKINPDYQPLS